MTKSPDVPAPLSTYIERVNNLFGRERYVRITYSTGAWFVVTPVEAAGFLSSCSAEEVASLKVEDVYMTPASYDALPEFSGP